MQNQQDAIAIAERFLNKDFNHLPINNSVDPNDTLQESPDLNLWQDLEIKDYEIIAPFVTAGQMTLEVSVDFAKPDIADKIVYMMIDMDQGNSFCLYKGIQSELRQALAAA